MHVTYFTFGSYMCVLLKWCYNFLKGILHLNIIKFQLPHPKRKLILSKRINLVNRIKDPTELQEKLPTNFTKK